MSGIRSLNGLNSNTININTINSGSAIDITSSSNTASTCNVKISKQNASTSANNTDLFLLEETNGDIKKIAYSDFITGIDTNFWTFNSPNIYPKLTSTNLIVGGTTNTNSRKMLINGTAEITGNSFFNTISTGTWNGTRLGKDYIPTDTVYDADIASFITLTSLTTAENFGTALSRTDPDTLNVGTGGNNSGVGTTTNLDAYVINIGKLVATGGGNSTTEGASHINIQATQYYNGNPKIDITAQAASGVVNTGAEVNITSKKVGSGSNTAKITMIADTEIIMNSLFKIDTNGLPIYNSLKILNENSLVAGTNIGLVNNNGAITINATDTNTTYSAGTNITLSGTTFNLDTTIIGNMTYTGSQFYQNTIDITGPASSLGYITLYSNDNNKISIKTNVNLGSTFDVILPSSTGTLALTTQIPTNNSSLTNGAGYITASSTTVFTNKSFNDTTNFNLGLNVKNTGNANVSGAVAFFNKDNTNYVDLRLQNEDVDANINVFLPTTLDNTVLVGQQTTDILANKTFNSNTQFNLGIQLFNSTAGSIQSTITSSQVGMVFNTDILDVDTDMKIRNIADQDEYIQIGDTFNVNYDRMNIKQFLKITNASAINTYIQLGSDIFYSNCDKNGFKQDAKIGNDSYIDTINLKFKDNMTLFQGNVRTNNGGILVGENGTTINLDCAVNHAPDSINSSSFFTCYFNFVQIGDIRQASTSSVSFNTTSDYRLKTDIEDFTDSLNLIKNLKVKKYKFKSDKQANIFQDHIGLIAHEVKSCSELFNTVVSGEKDEMGMWCSKCNKFYCSCEGDCGEMIMKEKHQVLDYSKLTPYCIGAIQEQQKQIDTLTDLVNTMKITIDKLNNSSTFKSFKS